MQHFEPIVAFIDGEESEALRASDHHGQFSTLAFRDLERVAWLGADLDAAVGLEDVVLPQVHHPVWFPAQGHDVASGVFGAECGPVKYI